MSIHDRLELEREGRLIRKNTRASLMSDTKWRKLLAPLDRPDLGLERCIVKFVDISDETMMYRPKGLHPPRPWVDTDPFGPIPLRSIEWLLFPRLAEVGSGDRTIPAKSMAQDVDNAARVVAALGRYPMELSERGLLIRGYLPSARVT